MRRELRLPDESISSIGRELRLTGDLVYAGGFESDINGQSSALFFARLFTAMADDGSGVFIDPKTFGSSKLILDSRIFDAQKNTIGYVVEEIIEPRNPSTLFCGVMLHADGLSDVRHILQTSMLWPMLSAIDARCSSCGKSYNYRTPFEWCRHIRNGKQPIVEARIRRLVLTEEKIKQNLMTMFDAPNGFADLALEPLDGIDDVIQMGGGEPDEMVITFAVSRDVGYDSVTVGEFSLRAGQRIAIPMSMIRDTVDWDLVSSSMVVPIDHVGSIRSLFPMDAVPDATTNDQQE